MNLRSWLQRLFAVKENVRLGFLHTFFRRAPRDLIVPVKEEPTADGNEIFEHVSVRDDYRIRVAATRKLAVDAPYGELLAPLAQLTRNSPDDEVQSVVERLSQLDQEIQFPLDVYWQAIGPRGLLQADEWLHYGTGSRRSALDLLLPAAEGAPGKAEDVFNFSLHCAVRPIPIDSLSGLQSSRRGPSGFVLR